jgi:phage terminase Nu1 subunit (DNA packaging protein)
MTTQTEDTKAVLASLEVKLTDARMRLADTQAKAAELAYPANTGDESARKKLDGLNAKVAMVAPEIASLEAAIVTAKRHVADVEAADVDETERARARDALALLDDFSQRGKLLDDAMGNFVSQYDERRSACCALSTAPRCTASSKKRGRHQGTQTARKRHYGTWQS